MNNMEMQTLKERRWMRFSAPEEGDLSSELAASLPDDDIDLARVAFVAADPTAPPAELGTFDCLLITNLLTSMPDPAALLALAPSLLRPGGVLVVATDCGWDESRTLKARWLGGFKKKNGEKVTTRAGLAAVLTGDFELVEEKDLGRVRRRDARRFWVDVVQASVWRRVA
jgi:SAM-dependent methyltransferase